MISITLPFFLWRQITLNESEDWGRFPGGNGAKRVVGRVSWTAGSPSIGCICIGSRLIAYLRTVQDHEQRFVVIGSGHFFTNAISVTGRIGFGH